MNRTAAPAGPPSDTVTVPRSPPAARATRHISSSPSLRPGGRRRRPAPRPQASSPHSLIFRLRGSTDTVSPPGDDSPWAPGDGLSVRVTAVIVPAARRQLSVRWPQCFKLASLPSSASAWVRTHCARTRTLTQLSHCQQPEEEQVHWQAATCGAAGAGARKGDDAATVLRPTRFHTIHSC